MDVSNENSDFRGDVFRIALGVALGGVLLWAALEYRGRYIAEQAAAELKAVVNAAESERRAKHAVRSELQSNRARMIVEQREARAARLAAEAAKEAAWQRFYKPSSECW